MNVWARAHIHEHTHKHAEGEKRETKKAWDTEKKNWPTFSQALLKYLGDRVSRLVTRIFQSCN